MSDFRVFTYTCADPDCPLELRAVAHVFAPTVAKTGARKGVKRLGLLPATQTGSDATDCGNRLNAFLEAEIARERQRAENAKAQGERMRARWEKTRSERT